MQDQTWVRDTQTPQEYSAGPDLGQTYNFLPQVSLKNTIKILPERPGSEVSRPVVVVTVGVREEVPGEAGRGERARREGIPSFQMLPREQSHLVLGFLLRFFPDTVKVVAEN